MRLEARPCWAHPHAWSPSPHRASPAPPRGLDNAGKTTILKKFNGEDIDTISPTLGFNIQTLEYGGCAAAPPNRPERAVGRAVSQGCSVPGVLTPLPPPPPSLLPLLLPLLVFPPFF